MSKKRVGGWSVTTEADLGGRITSLRDPAGRQWLGRIPDPAAEPARRLVQPGAAFVDAGAWEECFPTIIGDADHGEVWSRPWTEDGKQNAIQGEDYRLHRELTAEDGALEVSYRLEAAPGFRFIWAAHLTLELSPTARLVAVPGTPCRLWPDHWRGPSPIPSLEGPWPAPLGARLDALPLDGTALFFMLLDPTGLTVADGHRLRLRITAPGQPTAIAVWRNLGGWPDERPYRSIVLEPAIGRHYDRDAAPPGDLGTVGPSGTVEWTLHLDTPEPNGKRPE